MINWVLPLESFATVFEQLGYLVSDPDKFEADEFVIALVDAITIFPPAKPLKLFTAPLKAMTRAMKVINPKFAKHFGGFINKVMQKAKKGDFDTLWNMLPFLVLAAEMYNDEEARKGLEFLISTVDSADDVVAWVDYLALPADGWEGEGDPPPVDAFGSNPQAALPLSFMFRQAQAAPSVARIAAGVFGEALKKLSKRVTGQEIKSIPDALALVRKELDVTDFRDFRKYVFRTDMMKAAVWTMTTAGSRALRNFIKGKSNARYKPATIAAIMAYLGWESACGIALESPSATPEPATPDIPIVSADDLGCNGKGLNEQVRIEVAKKLLKVFADSASTEFDEEPISENGLSSVSAGGHGALFHLGQIAYFQLQHRFGGGLPIKGVERPRWVGLFESGTHIPQEGNPLVSGSNGYVLKKLRYVDILMGKEGEPETWVEVKSYASQTTDTGPGRHRLDEERRRGEFQHWDIGKEAKGTTLHKQFSLDRAAKVLNVAWLTKKEGGSDFIDRQVVIAGFEWRFQAFRVKNQSGQVISVSPLLGNPSTPHTLRWLLNETPKVTGFAKEIQTASFGSETGLTSKSRLATVSTLISDLVSNGFDLAAEALEEEIDID